MLESKVQREIRRMLEKHGWLVNKIMITTLNGWPDLIAHRDGMTMYIETKRPGEKLDPVQVYRHEQIKSKGIHCFKADSPTQAVIEMMKLNIKP